MLPLLRRFSLFLALIPSGLAQAGSLGREIERAIGRATFEAAKAAYGAIEGGLLEAWVRAEASRVGEAFPGWRFQVCLLNSAEPNAFSAPGGFVFVTWRLLETVRSDDELAGVLAHEMAHSALHHAVEVATKQFLLSQALGTLKDRRYRWLRRMGGWGLVLLALSDMRAGEREADSLVVRACLNSGYDPEGLARFLERISGEGFKGVPEFLLTHPPISKRVARIKRLAEERASPQSLCRLGWALLHRGRVKRAKEFFEKALELDKGWHKAKEGVVACFLRAGLPKQARREARRLGLEADQISLLERKFLPQPLPFCPSPPWVKREVEEALRLVGEESEGRASEAAEEALRLVSELSPSVLGHQIAVQIATLRASSDLRWLLAYIEALGLAAHFREALFSLECSARWVRGACLRGGEKLEGAGEALLRAKRLLEKAHRAVRPNILGVALSSLSRGRVSEVQLAMLQTSFFSAQRWLSRSISEAERALEWAGREEVEAEEEALGREFLSLSPPGRGLALELALLRLGGEREEMVSLLRRGVPFGTACVLLGVASFCGEEPSRLAPLIRRGQSGAELLEGKRVYAPDLALVLRMLRRDMEEVSSLKGAILEEEGP